MITGCVRNTKMRVLLMYEIKCCQNDFASKIEDEKKKNQNYMCSNSVLTNNKHHNTN